MSKIAWAGVLLPLLVAAAALGSLWWTKLHPTTVERTVQINATAAEVWDALTDTAAYPQWNPFLVSSTGRIRVGATLTNTLRNHGSEMTFRPTVLVADPERELRWIGRFGVPGLVDGEHYFIIDPTGPDTVTFTQGERFSGALVPVVGSALDVGDAFEAMNEALKQRVA